MGGDNFGVGGLVAPLFARLVALWRLGLGRGAPAWTLLCVGLAYWAPVAFSWTFRYVVLTLAVVSAALVAQGLTLALFAPLKKFLETANRWTEMMFLLAIMLLMTVTPCIVAYLLGPVYCDIIERFTNVWFGKGIREAFCFWSGRLAAWGYCARVIYISSRAAVEKFKRIFNMRILKWLPGILAGKTETLEEAARLNLMAFLRFLPAIATAIIWS